VLGWSRNCHVAGRPSRAGQHWTVGDYFSYNMFLAS